MALTCFLFRAVGLTAHGTALGPTIRLKPTSLDGEGSEIWSGVLTVPPCAQTSLDEAKSRSTKPVDTAVGREPFAPCAAPRVDGPTLSASPSWESRATRGTSVG